VEGLVPEQGTLAIVTLHGCKPCAGSKVCSRFASRLHLATEKLADGARITVVMALNVVKELGDLPGSQHGYFTRAQAAAAGVEDFELTRAVNPAFIDRVDHGVYRVAGAGHDEHSDLRIAWFRLDPSAGPRERIRHPRVWVSHESAAALHGFGVYLADTHSFISMDRLQPGKGVKMYRRSGGLERHEHTVVDGFAVTIAMDSQAALSQ